MRRWKTFVREAGASLLAQTGVTLPARRAEGCLSIATFHRVLPRSQRDEYPLPGLAVTPDEFEWYVRYFLKHYCCGTLRDVARRWQRGEKGPRPWLAVTFDDGQADNYDHARPVLRRLGVQASFFLTAEYIGTQRLLWHDRLGFGVRRAERSGRAGDVRRLLGPEDLAEERALDREAVARAKQLHPERREDLIRDVEGLSQGTAPEWAHLMDWTHVAELLDDGHEIGSHSMSHPLLPQCTDDQLEYEVARSRQELERRSGASIDSFCYPNGDHDDRVVHAVKQAGYEMAVATQWGSNPRGADPYRWRRYDMNADHTRTRDGTMSAPTLAWRMSGLFPRLG